jgi:hypothetical protein
MEPRKKPEYGMDSGNVFTDLKFNQTDELLIRARLGHIVP